MLQPISKIPRGRSCRPSWRIVTSSPRGAGYHASHLSSSLSWNHPATNARRLRTYPPFRGKSTMAESTSSPLAGLWKPTHLKALWYGPGSVRSHLVDSLPSGSSKAFIVTGSSLAKTTALIQQVEQLLGPAHHAGTFASIKQHAPVAQLDEATDLIVKDSSVDTIISIGGGSPIDSSKAISYRLSEKTGRFLFHITVPTTLSAAECTFNAGYTQEDGTKTGVAHAELAPHVIIYDSKFALETPPQLWMSTGLRALDHSVEMLYHPTASEVPAKDSCLSAAARLFSGLPKYRDNPKDEDNITQLQLASFASLAFLGLNVKGPLGLSHTLGYALGSPYSIPHGITSCLTLGHVVKLKAQEPQAASQIATLLPFLGLTRTGNDQQDAAQVGDAILGLVKALGLAKTLREYGVGEDQVPIIVKRATRQDRGEVYDKVAGLVKQLY